MLQMSGLGYLFVLTAHEQWQDFSCAFHLETIQILQPLAKLYIILRIGCLGLASFCIYYSVLLSLARLYGFDWILYVKR